MFAENLFYARIFTGLTGQFSSVSGVLITGCWKALTSRTKFRRWQLAYEQMNIMVMDCLDEGKAIADEFAGSDKLDSGKSRQMQSGC